MGQTQFSHEADYFSEDGHVVFPSVANGKEIGEVSARTESWEGAHDGKRKMS